MSRRSSRLVSGGYYNSDDESDSSSVTNISYRENPVKVFKKKAGTRKARTPNTASNNASSGSPETPVTAGLSPSPLAIETQSTPKTYVSTIATPRPALTPSASRSQTPIRCPTEPQEKSPDAWLCSSSRPGLHPRPGHKELSQSSVDSSGYSSSEGPQKKPTAAAAAAAAASSVSGIHGNDGTVGNRVSSAFFSLMDSVSFMAIAVQSKIMHLAALANTSLSSHMKKACALFLLLLLLLLCVWFLLPLLTSLMSRMTVTKIPSQTKPESQHIIPATPPQLNTIHPTPVVDPAIVSAAVEVKMRRVLEELQLKQERLLTQMKERLQLDMQNMKANLELVDSDSRLRLEQELAELGRQLMNYQTESRSAAASLSIRIQDLEAQNAKLAQDLSSIQQMPPPAPCPDTSTIPVLNHLTPELQQAMEKWFTERIKEHDAIRLSDRGSCSDCGRPMADKMPDFALETQGASVISTRCSETYRIRSACMTLFGFPLWYPSESPRTVIQGYPVLLPGKCWAFHGVQGTLVISLSHPIKITHVTLDHLPRYNSPTSRIDSAPKDFEVYGMQNDTEEGTLLGTFTYDENGESTQTFKLPSPSDVVYRYVELRVLSNWGHVEYTCLYRFRVHGNIST
ncbi:SUN domain-containing protein 1 Protein unc-84-like protein A Sad1/unc-84 protein-like 1 [Larimichthys crocea]|uniref:SUN domain-containing protein 1 Protein unc-84-like protein A Sad1/unc-84 protein-like 1 n=1 Tax=Larimichthys crocea TaxID=215358 RepID=A0A6G0J9W0_LARCR|nr:SUN domain-containing protein 1 Protein unc-84-like protein A Sad1/unc-84 protein-like 1 [Larimichthys crocea]